MKPAILLFLLLCTAFAHGQEIPKNAGIIVIKSIGFDEAMSKLIDSSHYEVKKLNKDNMYVRTKFKKACDDCITAVSISLRVVDSVAYINGKWTTKGGFLSGLKDKIDDEEFVYDIKNEKGRPAKEAFKAMLTFALSLNRELSYKIIE